MVKNLDQFTDVPADHYFDGHIPIHSKKSGKLHFQDLGQPSSAYLVERFKLEEEF